MTWEIVVGIITLIGVFGSVATWVSKLSKTLATLDTTIQMLKETLDQFREGSKQTHKELYDKIDDHEIRITKLETKDTIH